MFVSEISSLPVRQAPAITYNLSTISARLGTSFASEKWQVGLLTKLIENRGFPKPLPTMRGADIIDHILPRRSRWRRDLVDAWFDGQAEPDALDAVALQEQRAAAARMDAAAAALSGGVAA